MEERYGICLTPRHILDIEERIRKKCPLVLDIGMNKIVRVFGHWYYFCYDNYMKQVTTCMPRGHLRYYRKECHQVKKHFIANYRDKPDHPLWLHCNKRGKIDANQLRTNQRQNNESFITYPSI